jgi:cytosine/adenosine deaminase-related metal-dependent hydrolase
MATLLVRSAEVLATMDPTLGEIPDGGMFVRDGWIEQVGPTSRLPTTADRVIDLRGRVAIPGMVNTHHHLYQTLTRAVPQAQDLPLFGWLRALYPIWGRMTPQHVRVATTLGLVELALSGCTTAFDHQYLWPGGSRVDDQVEAARRVGIRFHVSRGSMSLGQSQGGLPPDGLVEDEEAILDDCRRVVDEFHDPDPGAMTRVVLAPCSPFSVTDRLMAETAELARSLGVRLHTHLAETRDEEEFCRSRFGMRPVDYAERLGWLGDDVWFAHAVHVSDPEVARLATTGTGVAHCPTSNMRLASGTAPLARYLDAGVPVGLGVDGSASNDSSHLLAEARQALLLARLAAAPGDQGPLLAARKVLELATVGGARVLGRDDIGTLAPGKAADLAAFRVDDLIHAGALHDPVAALVLCAPQNVDLLLVGGVPVVEDGTPVTVDREELVATHNRLAAQLLAG